MKFIPENFNQFKNKIGIYKITVGSHVYIGSSKNLANRLKYHYNALKKGVHFNNKFQACYDKYKDKCIFEISEYCELEILLQRETYYIAYFCADINIIKDPCNIIWTEKSIQNLKNSLKRYYKAHVPLNSRPVYMYSIKGEFITSYKSVSEAGRIYNVSPSAISHAIRNNICSVGFQWSYNFEKSVSASTKNYEKIRQIDCNTSNIKTWNSIYEAAFNLQIDIHLIKNAIQNKTAFLNSYWKIWHPYKQKPKEEWKKVGRKVYQYDLEGNFLKEYKCVNEASRQTGINNHSISSTALKANSYNKSAGGYQWSYEKVDCLPKYINNSSKAKIKSTKIFNILTGEESSFYSVADAVRYIDGQYTDCAASSISSIVSKGGFYKYYMATRTFYKVPKRNISIYNVKLNKVFSNADEAAKYFNITKLKIKNYCKNINNSEWLYLADCARQKLRESGKIFK